MKIAVTSQNFRTVTGHAGRARRFLIYDVAPAPAPAAKPTAGPAADIVETDRLDLPKELAMHDFHGHGPHPLDGVDVILTQGFGEGFARRMAGRGIVAATTDKTDPAEAVKAYLSRPQSTAPTPATCGCGHGHGEGHGHAHGHADGHRHGT